MNFRILAIAALLPFTLTFGQDVVRFYKGDSLTVKVTEIGESQIQYKRLDNLEGPAGEDLYTELRHVGCGFLLNLVGESVTIDVERTQVLRTDDFAHVTLLLLRCVICTQ